MQGTREQLCSLLLVPVLEGRQKFYERLVKPFQCQVGHWQVLPPVCVWIPCPAMPCWGLDPPYPNRSNLGWAVVSCLPL